MSDYSILGMMMNKQTTYVVAYKDLTVKVVCRNHFLDKPILRHLFWFIVLPYNSTNYLLAQRVAINEYCDRLINDNK